TASLILASRIHVIQYFSWPRETMSSSRQRSFSRSNRSWAPRPTRCARLLHRLPTSASTWGRNAVTETWPRIAQWLAEPISEGIRSWKMAPPQHHLRAEVVHGTGRDERL